jgi:hypothetical protein
VGGLFLPGINNFQTKHQAFTGKELRFLKLLTGGLQAQQI